MTDLFDDTEPRTPDGTRPLIVVRRCQSLTPARRRDGDPALSCYQLQRAGYLGIEPPATCRRLIKPGDHYLEHQLHDPAGKPVLAPWSYCAPCAITEWAFWDVREVTP